MTDTKKYRVVRGIDYGRKRAEPGDLVSDLPEKSIGWLLAQGHIEDPDDDKEDED